MKFMDWLNEGLTKTVVDDKACPRKPVEADDGDQVVVLTDELKQLYCFAAELQKQVVELSRSLAHDAVDLSYNDGESREDEHQGFDRRQLELGTLTERVKLLDVLFWNAVMFEFPDLSGKSLRLGAEWNLLALRQRGRPPASAQGGMAILITL